MPLQSLNNLQLNALQTGTGAFHLQSNLRLDTALPRDTLARNTASRYAQKRPDAIFSIQKVSVKAATCVCVQHMRASGVLLAGAKQAYVLQVPKTKNKSNASGGKIASYTLTEHHVHLLFA